MIEVEGVSKSFDQTKALAGVDMSVPTGTVQGLFGPDGAGKTTLVRILATLLAPDIGRARISGVDVQKNPNTVRSLIGLAGQYAAVDETLTGRENLVIVGRLYRLGAKLAKARAGESLERLGLVEAADRPVKTYSGGMRRRLDLGASLVGIGCGAPVIDQARAQITIPVCDPVPDLMAALRILDAAGIVPVDLGLRRPSLDDVFLSLTGRATGDDDPTAPLTTTPRTPQPSRSPTDHRRPGPQRLRGGADDRRRHGRRLPV
jgi:ABC-type Na+ transport system ATPase subunit NatA